MTGKKAHPDQVMQYLSFDSDLVKEINDDYQQV